MDTPTGDVVIGWVHPGHTDAAFTDSLLRAVAYDRQSGTDRIGGWNGVLCSANISAGRNALVEWFLASPAQWLMMIDTDMVWPPDAVHRLLGAADPVAAPIVGGLCFGQEPDTGIIFPTLYDLAGTEQQPQFVRYDIWAPNTLFAVMGTGAAFLLVHRGALETIRARAFSQTFPWFQERELAGKRIGEDITFCMRAAQCGVPVHVHTGVHIGHIKSHVVTAQAYLAQRAMLDAQRQEAQRQEEVPA